MNFLNPFFLIGSVVLAVPVLIHLVRRERSEIIHFSSLMFLLKVPKQVVRQQKLKNLLLMLLRLAILAFLVLAFTRPYLAFTPPKEGERSGDSSIVMLLDNSMSMRYGDHFERLKTEARKKIDAMGSNDKMVMVAFSDGATVLAPPSATGTPWTSDKNQLKAMLDTLELSFGGTRFYDAFTAADRFFSQVGNNVPKKLILISDFQRVGWNRASHENVIDKAVKTETVSVAEENPSNLGIESVSADATTFTRVYSGRIVARVRNYRKVEAPGVPVTLTVNGKEVQRRTLTIPPNASSLAEFTGFDLTVGLSKAAIRIEAEDPLREDNEFVLALERREKLKVLLVDNGRKEESFQLRTALTASETLPFQLAVVPAGQLAPAELANHQVVIVNDVPRLNDAVWQRMGEMRKTGQGQLIILAQNADLNWWGNQASLPVKPTRQVMVRQDRGQPFVSVTNYDRNHVVFRPFEKSAKLTLSLAEFFAYVEVQPRDGAAVMARFDDGSPWLVESKADDRGLAVMASTVHNIAWSDLPLKISFVPLVDEMVRYLSRYSETRSWYALGEGVPIVGSAEGTAASVNLPSGEREPLGDIQAGQQRFYSPSLPGFYDLKVGKDLRLFAVDPPTSEGNLEVMLPEDLLASVGRLDDGTGPKSIFQPNAAEEHARRSMSWWYLLLAAVLFAISEIFLANRTQRSQIEPRRA